MKILFSVLSDLWNFALPQLRHPEVPKALPPRDTLIEILKETMDTANKKVDKHTISPHIKEPAIIDLNQGISAQSSAPIYPAQAFVSVAEVPCYVRPALTFDGVIMTFPYNTTLNILKYEGRFAQVKTRDSFGWVEKEYLTTDKNDIYPNFKSEQIYLHNNLETIKLRRLIKDEFTASDLLLPLQAVEHVTYTLQTGGRKIVWGSERPRLPGSWQQFLKGIMGIYIGITPKTDSIMEYFKDADGGRLAYVEAVAPDETLTISIVGDKVAGQYEVKKLPSEVWKELRPVFISVN